MKTIDQKIADVFKDRKPEAEGFQKASAVLVPIMEIENEPHLILTQRAFSMKHQPGDICFPGGGCKEGETAEETALRETGEEIGIPPENIDLLGPADVITTAYGVYIKPFVGILKGVDQDDFVINPDEVEKVLTMPLKYLMETEPKKYTVDLTPNFPEDFPFELIQGGKDYKFGKAKNRQSFYEYEGDVIWGLTARILNNVKQILNN